MGVITITISRARKPQIKPRTHDKASTLATLYADLFERLERAAKDLNGKTQDDFNPEDHPKAPAGQANGGQFVKGSGGGGPVGEKPTTVKAKAGKPANVKLQPASSFSAQYSTANTFAGGNGTVYLCKIPASQVLGTYLTGFGCTGEHEVVVLGHDTIKSFPVKKSEAQSLSGATSAIKTRIEAAKGK